MIEITDQQVSDAMDAALAEKGEEFIYVNDYGTPMRDSDGNATGANCLYVHANSGNPVAGCFVGNVLHRLGVSLEWLSKYEGTRAAVVVGFLQDDGIMKISESMGGLLGRVQGSQDRGATWGEAVEYGRKFVKSAE